MAKKPTTRPTYIEVHVTYGIVAGKYYTHPEIHCTYTPEGEYETLTHGTHCQQSRDDMILELRQTLQERGINGSIVLTKSGHVTADQVIQWMELKCRSMMSKAG